MKTTKLFVSLFIVLAVLLMQAGSVFAAPAQQGTPPADEESQNPVGAALAALFGDIAEYETIMEAHDNGFGFGVIAQTLWLIKNNVDGDKEGVFLVLLDAKKTGDYSYFSDLFGEDEIPTNWGQFKKALLNGEKKANLGQAMSDKEKPDKGKPDKEKSNNGDNGAINGNKDKDKDKNKDN